MVTNLLAYIIAVAIPLLAIYLIYALDLFGTGKIGTVLLSMGWGLTFAFGLAYFINTALLPTFGRERVVTLAAPMIEEFLKAIILIWIVQSARFRYVVDGAIYGFAVGIGFSVIENIFYLSGSEAALTLAISRVLSTSLMHATTSGVVGISLGRLRRADTSTKFVFPIIGILLAAVLHVIYNNVVNELGGAALLLVAIAMGVSGSVFIARIINRTIAEEKASFTDTLTDDLNVSGGELQALQRLGGTAIEKELQQLEAMFGSDNLVLIRRLLVAQANIGILQNNLNLVRVSDRLRRAWERDLKAYQDEVTKTRKQLGIYVTTYMQTMFPAKDNALWDMINAELAESDPTLINQFDMFMRVSSMAQSFTPEQLEEMATRLKTISIFKYIDIADLENLSRALESAAYLDGGLLFDQGDEGDSMYLIKQGNIDIFTLDQNKKEKKLRRFNAGDVVGDFAVLDGEPRSARARAANDLRAFRLTRRTFMMFIQSRPSVMIAVLQVLAEKARFTTASVEKTITMASNIAQGNYDATIKEAESLSTELAIGPEDEHSELPEATPEKVTNLFAMAASKLKQRELPLGPKP